MNYKLLIILTINFLTLETFAQEVTTNSIDSISMEIAQNILSRCESNEVLIYSVGCIGCENDEVCDCYDGFINIYLIWADNDSEYIKKINCCVNTCSIETNLNELLIYYQDNKDSIFSSTFKTDYLEIHHVFNRIKSVKADTILSQEIFHYYFNEDYKYKTHNFQQPVNHFITMLKNKIILIEKEIGFTEEH